MYAMELSGIHLGKVLRVRYKVRNKDGTVRANAKEHEYFLLLKRIEHDDAGRISYQGWWYKEHPPRGASYWNKQQKDRWTYRGWDTRVALDLFGIPTEFPYYAEVEVLGE